jgi:RNA polymerase sigma-70 factor, ECF subfamily
MRFVSRRGPHLGTQGYVAIGLITVSLSVQFGSATPPEAPSDEGRLLPTDTQFTAIYEEHFDLVWRLLSRLGVRPSDLDDAVQEVFLALHHSLPRFRGDSSLKTWIVGIALRVAAANFRRRRNRDSGSGSESELVDPNPDPFEAMARTEAVRTLYAVLDELDAEKREVLVLVDIEGMNLAEVEQSMQVNVNTLASRLRAARKQFDAALRRRRARERSKGRA